MIFKKINYWDILIGLLWGKWRILLSHWDLYFLLGMSWQDIRTRAGFPLYHTTISSLSFIKIGAVVIITGK